MASVCLGLRGRGLCGVRDTMGPGGDALFEAEALCGIAEDFPSMPLASESTEADENSPDPHRNSVSPRSFLSVKASMSLPFKETPAETHFSSGKYQENNSRGCKDRSFSTCHLKNNEIEAIGHTSSLARACRLAGRGARRRSPDQQRERSSLSSENTSDPVPKASTPRCFSDASDGSGSDDGVTVYIDETDDDDTKDGLLITECRISSRRAAEIRAFKAQWVEQMLQKKNQFLNSCLARGVRGGKRQVSNKETNGHEAGTDSASSSGVGFLEDKLKAFAACMMPEALECISCNGKRWAEATTSDSSESDSAESPRASSRCSQRRHDFETLPRASLARDQRPHTSANPRVSKTARETHEQGAHRQAHQQRAADAALRSWGRFLKYIRKTSQVLPARRRIEQKAGLESDDDDEQAPLYMCRPGSVQRPSPLISHSLTEHLKASGTMFFKQFRRQCLSGSAPLNPDATGIAPTQPQQSNALQENSVSASPDAAHAPPSSEAAAAAVNDNKRKPHAESDTEEAVPLYEISAGTSALFGDMMRLEDTARMLDASCTFRLPAAPSSVVRRENCKLKTSAGLAHLPSEASAFSSGAALWAAATPDAPATAVTAAAASCHHKRKSHVTLYTSPHAATAAALSKLIANCQMQRSSKAQERLHISCSATAGVNDLKRGESCSNAKAKEGDDSCVVYTVQADEDTLALSGLDAEYCARVESASRGGNRAAGSLAHLEHMLPHGSAVQGNVSSVAMHKKRKVPVDNNVVLTDDEDSGNERFPVKEETSGAACHTEAVEEANYQRSLMVDKLMLAHLMPYLPQFSPP